MAGGTDYESLLAGGGAAPAPQQGATDYESLLNGDGSSVGPANAAQIEGMAKDRFDAMQKSYRDAVPGGAGFFTTMAASLPLDVKKRIAIFAKARGIPEDHYGVDNQGNIGFIDPVKGGWVREVPTLAGGQGWSANPADQFQRLGSQVADVTGPMISQVAGGGAAALAPPPAKIPAAAGGAFVADLVRQAAGNYLAGSSPLDGLSYSNAAGQAALAGAGEGLGELAVFGLNKAFGRNSLRAAGADLPRLRDPIALQQYQQLQMEAQRRGITLTPGNITQVRSLLAAERQIYRQPEGQNALDAMYQRRNAQEVPAAFRQEIDQISGQASPALGARSMQAGAQAVMVAVRRARTAAASPGYRAAFASGVVPDIQPVLDMIADARGNFAASSAGAHALDTTYNDLTGMVTQRLGGRPVQVRVPIQNYEQMHSAKEAIDNTLAQLQARGVAPSEITKAEAVLTPIQQRLTRILRDAHPEYERGYQAYIAESPPVDAASNGLVGLMAHDRVHYDSVPGMLANGDPMSISQARTLYQQNGQLGAWNDGTRAFLENMLRDALRPTQTGRPSNVAGKLYQGLWGDPTMRANIEAALGVHGPISNARAQSFNSLMEVLQAAATSLPEGSPTATDLTGRAAFAGRPTKMAASVVRGANPFNIPEQLSNAMLNWSQGRNVSALADLYTNNAALQELQRLRLMNPRSAAAVDLVANVLTKYGYLEARPNQAPQTPAILLQQPGAATAP